MIIACPACSTRYVVPDTAIGVDGRTVRCAKCRHSWFQAGPEVVVAPEVGRAPEVGVADARPVAPPVPAASAPAAPAPSAPPPPVVDEAEQARPEPPAAATAAAAAAPEPDLPFAEPPVPSARRRGSPVADAPPADDLPSTFEHEPPFRPRRNPARLWTAAAVAFALTMAAMTGAVWWFGMPDWLPWARPGFRAEVPGLELSFPATKQDRRTLPNGTEYFGASGTITNTGKDTREIPPLLIQLVDSQNRIVGYREIRPPKPALQPGESVTVNEALTDVSRTVVGADIGWKAE